MQLIVPHPAADESLTLAGELTAWYAEPGQSIQAGELLYQVTWPGYVIDYSAETSGTLLKQHIKLREAVHPHACVGEIEIDPL